MSRLIYTAIYFVAVALIIPAIIQVLGPTAQDDDITQLLDQARYSQASLSLVVRTPLNSAGRINNQALERSQQSLRAISVRDETALKIKNDLDQSFRQMIEANEILRTRRTKRPVDFREDTWMFSTQTDQRKFIATTTEAIERFNNAVEAATGNWGYNEYE